jgi:hypothetical protein
MIVKINKHDKPGQVLNYISRKPSSSFLTAKNCGGIQDEDKQHIKDQFTQTAKLNPRVKRTASHIILSLPKGQDLSPQDWQNYAQEFLKKMGYANAPWVLYRHDDTEHSHCHVLASRVTQDGKCVSDKYDFFLAQKIIRELSMHYDLKSFDEKYVSKHYHLSLGECRHLANGRPPSQKQTVYKMVTESLNQSQTLEKFTQNLESTGVTVLVKDNERGKGIVFEKQGFHVSGSQLGRAFTYSNLINQLKQNQLTIESDSQSIARKEVRKKR